MELQKSLFCRKCGAKLLPDSMFCDKCGTKVVLQQEEPVVVTTLVVNQQNNANNSSNTHQSEENEYLRQFEIRQERNEAIQKRIAVTKVTEKKKKTVKIIIICVVAALIAVGIICSIIDSAHNNELRNFATEKMSDEYTNVYADVVLVEPEYFVYTSRGTTYREITEVVCKCKTVEDKTVWIVFYSWDYPGGSAHNEDVYEVLSYPKSSPARITGYVTTAGSVIKELEDSIGNVFVLRMEDIQK